MQLLQLMKQRYSCRAFLDRPLAEEDLEYILQAGELAPTARNLQPQRILVVNEAAGLQKLDACTPCRFGAPCALLVCYDGDACWKRTRFDNASSGEVDCSIVTTHMMLAAADRGVGSTWVMHFDPAALREQFALPEQFVPVAVLVLGYPAPNAAPAPAHTTYQPREQLVFRNEWKK